MANAKPKVSGLAAQPADAAPIASVDTKTIKFNANGGDGTMQDLTVQLDASGVTSWQVVDSTFTPKADKQFKSWNESQDGNGTEHTVGSTIEFTNADEFTLFAIWEDVPAQPAPQPQQPQQQAEVNYTKSKVSSILEATLLEPDIIDIQDREYDFYKYIVNALEDTKGDDAEFNKILTTFNDSAANNENFTENYLTRYLEDWGTVAYTKANAEDRLTYVNLLKVLFAKNSGDLLDVKGIKLSAELIAKLKQVYPK